MSAARHQDDVATDRPDTLYKSDQEIARIVGIGEEKWRNTVPALERQGLPQRDPMFANRRYWPAVKAFLDRRAGLRQDSPPSKPDGKENLDA